MGLELQETFGKSGPVAQLGERLDGIQEVAGSIPVRSTIFRLSKIEIAKGDGKSQNKLRFYPLNGGLRLKKI